MKKINFIVLAVILMKSTSVYATDSLKIRVHGVISSKTCSLKDDHLLFDFGNIYASDFSGEGTATGWIEKSFISAGCDPAITDVNMTFSGTPDDNIPQLIKVEGGAKGVAIELRSYDDFLAVPDGATSMRWDPRKSGEEYKFKARLVQSTSRFHGGPLNAKIIVNMSYM